MNTSSSDSLQRMFLGLLLIVLLKVSGTQRSMATYQKPENAGIMAGHLEFNVALHSCRMRGAYMQLACVCCTPPTAYSRLITVKE